MKTQQFLKYIAIVLGAIALFSVIFIVFFYTLQTGKLLSVQSYENYAQIGDFFGGTLNPLLTIINICIFIYLTIVIQQAADRNNQESISTNKWVALLNLKFDEFKHFRQEVDRALDLWLSNPTDASLFQEFLRTYNIQEYRLSVLIPSLGDMEHNKSIRKYIHDASDGFRASKLQEAARISIPISNTYGMLIKDLGILIAEADRNI